MISATQLEFTSDNIGGRKGGQAPYEGRTSQREGTKKEHYMEEHMKEDHHMIHKEEHHMDNRMVMDRRKDKENEHRW